ncbi:hypothetical protein VKT23_012935 [Stygiomarasmius scandens]|uniref:Protein kinase domain-containing protein n=1 Tax=Marasmiellus scandens TaxID=2682957 RepID=A0ABR1J9P8_9AGAR
MTVDSMDTFFSSPFPRSNLSSHPEYPSIHILQSWNDSVPTIQSSLCIQSIRVDQPIASGDGKWAQVWRGMIHYGTKPGAQNKETIEVVLKIFQESLFPETDEDEISMTGAALALKEARAYRAMKSLQGIDVPVSYGFHKALVSYCGEEYEPCFMHILQFIPLPTLTSISSPLTDDTISSLLDSLIPSLQRIHQCGIAHNDLSLANVLAQIENTSSSQSPQTISKVYFIDFAMSAETNTKSIKDDAESVIGVLSLLRVHDPDGSVLHWYQQHLGEPCASMFRNVRLKEMPKNRKPFGIYPEATKSFRDIASKSRWVELGIERYD